MLWSVYGEDDVSLMALSGVEWRIWDRLREAVKFDSKAQEICKKIENQEAWVDQYRLKDGLLLYKNLVYVPGVLRLHEEILAHFHNSKEGGHSGWLRTYLRIKNLFYWEGLKDAVKTLVAECDTCQKVKYDQRQ
ncbi:hypothetical protein ACOSP7_005489 [Xanthoceras sorbifolium]